MLNDKHYNIEQAKKMTKENFFNAYKGKMPNIDKVYAWLQQKDSVKSVEAKSK